MLLISLFDVSYDFILRDIVKNMRHVKQKNASRLTRIRTERIFGQLYRDNLCLAVNVPMITETRRVLADYRP